MEEDVCSEYLDFAVETYRHASRYGDCPCDSPFLPRRGVFFWPMEKSELDQRRFKLWIQILKQMEKDYILIPMHEPNYVEYRDARYLFHSNYFRPPYFKAGKINWPHVKEWYFEFMNNTEESRLLNEAMSRLERYLNARESKEGMSSSSPPKQPSIVVKQNLRPQEFPEQTGPSKNPAEVNRMNDENHFQSKNSRPPFIYQRSSYDASESSSMSDTRDLHRAQYINFTEDSTEENLVAKADSVLAASDEKQQKEVTVEPQSPFVNICHGCSRCACRLEYPDDLTEGRLHPGSENASAQVHCDYIICHECVTLINNLEDDNFRSHLESPEHTCNVLSRLQKIRKSPIQTPQTANRTKKLEAILARQGYTSVSDYMSKLSHTGQKLQNLNSHPIISESTLNNKTQTPQFPVQAITTQELRISPEPRYERYTPDSKNQLSNPVDPGKMTSINADKTGEIANKAKSHRLSNGNIGDRFDSVESDLKTLQQTLADIGRQVETGANRTQALVRSFIRHDDAIKLLQKDATQGKAISDIMEGAIDAMSGSTQREDVTSRLERQEKGLDMLRRELKEKVDDLSCWLKVIDRHTNEITSLKQKVWINTQVNSGNNNPSDSGRRVVQKLECQVRIQQETTKSFMLKVEQRFDNIVRQYADELETLRQRDEDRQKQMTNLRAQLGLKFAHMEQKIASPRKPKR
ncbi:Hypothetical protein BGHDH14_bgh05823 [Blumeria hordei DH14]|uniref:Uncharacterized protein n=1 Tax=Blumeria graminis f. sp. hordei (strain DH14) TaxID=546991 RepID=N1JDZ2_BLUG1|nr:Hypothetical protein BGHDH14_bgh05823 [Blumeria hordei DH14]